MNWLNLNVSVLDSAEFVGSTQAERGTWLCLLRYCAGQENGGRIVGAKQWKSRKWEQVARVTLREVNSRCDLWKWDGDDLIVNFYPADKEQVVKTNRVTGALGGKSTSEAKSLAARQNGANGGRPKTQAKTEAEPKRNPTDNRSENPTERKGKEEEGKGMELELTFAPDGASSDPLPAKATAIVWNPSGGFSGITDADIAAWSEAFPALDIRSQVARAHQWLVANPTKRKKAVRRFLVSWLSRSQERGGDRSQPSLQPAAPDHHLGFRTSNRVNAEDLPDAPDINEEDPIPF